MPKYKYQERPEPRQKKRESHGCLTAFVPPGILKSPSFGGQSSFASDTKSVKSVRWQGLSTSTISREDPVPDWEDLKFNPPKLHKANLERQQQIFEELDRRRNKAKKNKRKEKHKKKAKRNTGYETPYKYKHHRPPKRMRTQPHKASYVVYTLFLALLAASVSLLAWAEWLRVNAYLEYLPLTAYEPISCEANSNNNGKIVHVDCPITKLYKFYPAKEFSWNMESINSLFFETRVEMFQYKVSPAKIGVSMKGAWSENREKSMLYSIRNYDNPHFWPTVPGQGRQFPPRLFAGSFELNPEVLTSFKELKQVPLKDDGYFQQSQTQPPATNTYYNSQAYNDYLYTGDPNNPNIGDMRLSFFVAGATHISAIGQQICEGYTCRLAPVPRHPMAASPTEKPSLQMFFQKHFGYAYLDDKYIDAIMAVREGDYSGDELLSAAVADKSLNTWKLVLLRFITFLFATIVGIWTIGLVHPNKWFMWTNGRTGNILGLFISGTGVGLFVIFGVVGGPVWLLGSWMYGGFLTAFGIFALILTIILTFTMSSVKMHRQGDGYTELKQIPEEFDRNPPLVEMDAPLVPNSNKTESSFYQAI